MSDDTRDRLIALEGDVKHLTQAVEAMTKQVAEMNALFQQAKGAKWVLMAMAAIGGFVASKLGALLPYIGGVPR
jgi:hypothetical protein